MAKKKKQQKIPEVLIFTDINNYQDDLASMVVLAYLAEKKLINIKGIITELGCYEVRRRRALYAKGVMVHLGLPFLRVVPGGDYIITDEKTENNYQENEFCKIFENAGLAILRSGTTFIQEYFKTVKDRNIVILFNAPFSDFAKYIMATQDTVQKKVKKIVIMGDLLKDEQQQKYTPNWDCFNFKFGAPAAETVLNYAQEKDIRLVFVPSQSVRDMQMEYEFLDVVASSTNPVAQQLLSARNDNPFSMHNDMLSALALADGVFKSAGGTFEKEEVFDKNVFLVRVADAATMRDKFCEIFQDRLMPKKISLAHLIRKKEERSDVDVI